MSFIYNPAIGGGSGSPGGLDTEIQFNNAGAFGGTTGLHWDSLNSFLQLDDNVSVAFGSADIWQQYSDGTDLIIERLSGTGLVKLGVASDKSIQLDKIGLGTSPVSNNFWVNFSQTTNKGRGALNFDLTYTGTNPQSNVLSKITFQGTGLGTPASPIAYPFLSQMIDDIDHSGTANYGNYMQFGTSGTRNITQGTKNFWGWRIENSLGVGDGLHTGGAIRQYGIWIGAFSDYVGVASQLKHGIYCAENISTRAGQAIVFDSTSSAMGDTLMTYIAADLALYTDINGTRITEAKADKVTFNVPPENYGISRACVHALNHYWTR